MLRCIDKFCVVVAICGLVSACATSNNSGLKPTPMENAWDTTMGATTHDKSDNLILVTMTTAMHNRLIQGESVKQEDELPAQYAQFLAKLAKNYEIKRVADWPLATLDIRCLVFEARSPEARDSVIVQLASEPNVESAQPLQYFATLAGAIKADPTAAYNDPYYKMQHGFNSMQIQASHRWATGKGVKVAVIDTGLDSRHADLREHVVGEKNFVDRDGGEFNKDIHGTAIAGVIAAATNNGKGMVGIAPDANIIALKACWQPEANDSKAACSSFTLAKALDFAITQQVDVINLSLAGPQDPLLERLVKTAMDNGILVVGAASSKKPDAFPAYVDGVIAVTEAGPRYRSASRDARANGFVKAPGEKVLSTSPGDQYDFYTGSSLSTAHIAGLTALIRQRKPHLSGNVIKALL
ncbi:MAG: S8 family peptidase, partial [Pseudomonadales bacterium]